MNCTHLIHDDSPVDGVGDDALDERYTVLEFQNADLLKQKKLILVFSVLVLSLFRRRALKSFTIFQ